MYLTDHYFTDVLRGKMITVFTCRDKVRAEVISEHGSYQVNCLSIKYI